MELDTAAKKPRMEENSASNSTVVPSRVLHVRNLHPEITDKEIWMLGTPFGQVSKVLLLRQKNQAFIEMLEIGAATALVEYYNSMPVQIRDKTIYIQFSKHQELKSQSGVTSSGGSNSSYGGSSPQSSGAVGGASSNQGAPNSILRIIIENMLYPITIDVLHQIFSKYGEVLKIVTFMKNGQFHALVQYSNDMIASAAKKELDGQNIYNGCCTLHIDYSKLSNLTVKYNNEKTRDFTRADLPAGDPNDQSTIPDLSAYGIPPGLLQSPAFSQLRIALAATLGQAGATPNPVAITPVVLASNLNDKMVSPKAIFILFGVYGDVVRVKILYNKRDSALVQFKEPQQAQNAVNHLHGAMLYGKKIHVVLSKHAQVQMPQAGSNVSQNGEDGLTEDFSNSPLHRFKKPGSKNYQNIFPPGATLHLSNVPETISEEYIRSLFSQTGGTVVNFRFFQNDRRMALIQLSNVDEAISALIVTHNHKISESNHLRVTFSKNTI